MANSLHHEKLTKSRGLVDIHIRATILGNTTPANGTFSIVEGSEAVQSFTRTGVGAYRITLREKYNKCLGFFTSIVPHGGGARDIRPGAVDTNARTYDFVVMNASLVAADTANAETDTVYIQLTVKNTSVAK